MPWLRRVMRRHAADRPDLPGTGGGVARHLLDEAGLRHVAVEPTDQGDHDDPLAPAVRLGQNHLDGRSIIAVAARELARAVRCRDGARPFSLRMALAPIVTPLRLVAIVLMTVLPWGGAGGAPAAWAPDTGELPCAGAGWSWRGAGATCSPFHVGRP